MATSSSRRPAIGEWLLFVAAVGASAFLIFLVQPMVGKHLLTTEAFALYVAALAPDGLLGVHSSNRHLDLIPLVTRVGLEQGLHALQVVNRRVPRLHSIGSYWVWLSRDPQHIQDLASRVRQRLADLELEANEVELLLAEPADIERIPVWTDDFSDLFGLLRRQGE